MKVIPFGRRRFDEYTGSVLETFEPNSGNYPSWNENVSWEERDSLDLKEQKKGTIVFVKCFAVKSDYVIEINNRYLEIWNYDENERNGLRCPIESIVSLERTGEGIKVEEGVLRNRNFSLMPHFCYDKSKPKLESALKPAESWSVAYMVIWVQKQKK